MRLKLTDVVLDEVFGMWWPKLQASFESILDDDQAPEEEPPLRTDRELLEEIVELSRLTHKRSLPNKLSPSAVRDLITALKTAVDAIQGDTDPQAALTALSSMQRPIQYMVRRTAGNDELLEAQWIKDLQSLIFEYQASENDDDDDEIPF